MDSPGSIQIEAFCPNCGQRTLVAKWGVAGHAELRCTNLGCDNIEAASQILGDVEREHIALLDHEMYSVQHPLIERLGGPQALHACEVNGMVRDLFGPPKDGPGVYRVRKYRNSERDSPFTIVSGGLEMQRIADLPWGYDDED